MDCDVVQGALAAWLDGHLDTDQAAMLESHLAVCSECRAVQDSLRLLDADLLRAFEPRRVAARNVAERVIGELDQVELRKRSGVPFTLWQVSALLAACAAGFLIATLIYRPWKADAPGRSKLLLEQPVRPAAVPVARLVATTGSVQVRERDSEDWRAVPNVDIFRCPPGSTVKTGPRTRCELKTVDGCVIRMNDSTEVTLASGKDVEVRQGQIWCSSPEDVSLRVLSPRPEKGSAAQVPYAVCSANSGMLTAVQGGGIQVTSDRGKVDIQTDEGTTQLEQGQTARIVSGQVVPGRLDTDPLLAARWIHALLVQKGHGDAELQQRVNAMLAGIGRSKLAALYEEEIRSLGEYGVLPLLRFVQSDASRKEPARRWTAMRILCDIAPGWAIPDLITLLEDGDPEVRCLSARALQRLTGLDQECRLERWRQPRSAWQPALSRWRRWWAENETRFPTPAGVSRARRSA